MRLALGFPSTLAHDVVVNIKVAQTCIRCLDLLAKPQTKTIEIHTPALSFFKGQKRPVTDYELNALADILNVSVDCLLGRE